MAAATSLAFLTPVYRRVELTEVCLRQRRWVCDELKTRYGLDATCIVVGDDENLDTARALGFLAEEHTNWAVRFDINGGKPYVALGMKFNAGYERAHDEGIDLVFPIGSDSWIDPVYFDRLPQRGELLLSRAYNLITPDARRRGALWIGWEGGVQWITWTEDWAHRNYQPVSDSLSKGCDTSTWVHKAKDIRIEETHHHQLEYVAFQSPENQITDYPAIMARYGVGEVTGEAVFGDLAEHYRADDILAMRRHYNGTRIVQLSELLGGMHREIEETQEEYLQLLDEASQLSEGEAA
jgi:hypothetical protein